MGTFMSALDMAGVSLSLMHLDEQLLELLDGPSEAFGWPAHVWQPTVHKPYAPLPQRDSSQSAAAGSAVGPIDNNPEGVRAAVQACAQACIDAEPDLTRFDSQVSVHNITLVLWVFNLGCRAPCALPWKRINAHMPRTAWKDQAQMAQTA